MKQLSVSLLGPFRVELDGEPVIDFATDKTRALLAFLIVEADRPHRRDALAGLLWPNFPQDKALQNLRKTLSRLRKAIHDRENDPPFLLIDSKTIRFNLTSDYQLDVAIVKTLSEACSDHPHHSREQCLPCIERMERIIELYQGDFLDQFFLSDSIPFEEWAATTRESLQRETIRALRHLIAYHHRRGETKRALALAWRQVELQPWREDGHRQLMHLLAEDDQRGAALAQYATCRKILANELKIEPTTETTALYEEIKAGDVTPSRRSPHAHTVNLPPPVTPFTGREEELVDLAERLANPDCRLLTLVGPGGIGKTRLALQSAADHVGIFRHGVCFVSLAAVDAPTLIAPTIIDALPFSLHGSKNPTDQLLDDLNEKELLLVLDNMEHLLDEASELLAEILHRAPGVTLLVTSRERLRLREEWVYPVDGLAYPSSPAAQNLERYSAVTLFTQTAQRIQHSFTLTEETRPWVVHICALVEGMPLGVELAASWASVRSCKEIARDIERNLDVLETSLRNVPVRHQSVRAAFEYSWDMLTAEGQEALRDLSVFRGGFQPDIADQGLGISPATLSTLAEKSLLQRTEVGRYYMHELLRQYAMEKLQRDPQRRQTVEEQHGTYFAHYLEERDRWLRDRKQRKALEEIAAEIENIRAAWQWAIAENRIASLRQMAGGIGIFYTIRGWNQEGSEVFHQAAGRLSDETELAIESSQRDVVLGYVLAWQGNFAYQLGQYEEAERLLRKSLEILQQHDSQREVAFSLLTLAQVMCHARHNYSEAADLFERGREIYREIADQYGMAQSLDGLGDVAARQGDHAGAKTHYEAGLALRRAIGDLWGISTSLGSLGGLAGRLGEYDDARRRFEESLAICRQIDNQRGIAACLHNLSTIAYLNSDYAEAQRLRLDALSICREIGYQWGIASSLKSLGDVYRQLGEHKKARRSLQESLAMFEKMGDRRAQALTLNGLGMAARCLENVKESWNYFRKALEAAMEIQETPLALDILSGIALLLADKGEREEALKLADYIHHHPASEQQTKDTLTSATLKATPSSALGHSIQSQGIEEVVKEILSLRAAPWSE